VRRISRISWITGFIVAVGLSLIWQLINTGTLGHPRPASLYLLQTITLVLWPPSILLLGTDGAGALFTWIVAALACLCNGFLYLGIGYGLARLKDAAKRD
jgi:hypothetical protein